VTIPLGGTSCDYVVKERITHDCPAKRDGFRFEIGFPLVPIAIGIAINCRLFVPCSKCWVPEGMLEV